jgi:hypothetical protein
MIISFTEVAYLTEEFRSEKLLQKEGPLKNYTHPLADTKNTLLERVLVVTTSLNIIFGRMGSVFVAEMGPLINRVV